MRHAVTALLDAIWLVFGYVGLLGIGKRFITGRYLAQAATIAVLVAFSAGVAVRRTLPPPAAVTVPGSAIAAPATAMSSAKEVPSDVGGACITAGLSSAIGKGNVDNAMIRGARSSVPITPRETLRSGDTLVVNGWAAAPDLSAPSRGVCIVVDGKLLVGIPVRYGEPRPDVAKAFTATALEPTGFSAQVPAAQLGAGPHVIQAVAVARDGSSELLPGSVRVGGPPNRSR